MNALKFMRRKLIRQYVSAGLPLGEVVQAVMMLNPEQLAEEYREMAEAL